MSKKTDVQTVLMKCDDCGRTWKTGRVEWMPDQLFDIVDPVCECGSEGYVESFLEFVPAEETK